MRGRMLAVIATFVAPFLITWYGNATQRPVDVTLVAVLLWGAGTLLWLHFVWPKLAVASPENQRPGNQR
jgi:hypothetical protein